MNELQTEVNTTGMFSQPAKSELRTIKMSKPNRTIKYNIGFKGDFTDLPVPFNAVCVGLYRKYALKDWSDSKKDWDYCYETNEFPYFDWNNPLTVMNKRPEDGKEIDTVTGKVRYNYAELQNIKPGHLNDWCIAYEKEVQSKIMGAPSFVRKVEDNGKDKIIKAFNAFYVLYMVDSDMNTYRFELKGSEYDTVDNMVNDLFANLGKGKEYRAVVSLGFEDTVVKSKVGEFYPIEIKGVSSIDNDEKATKFHAKGLEVYGAIKAFRVNGHQQAVEHGLVREPIEFVAHERDGDFLIKVDGTKVPVLEAPKPEADIDKLVPGSSELPPSDESIASEVIPETEETIVNDVSKKEVDDLFSK